MSLTNAATISDSSREHALSSSPSDSVRAHLSAVSWGAIIAGAAAAAALSLILLLLGVGLGLSAISPWAYEGASAATIGVSTILWVTFTQLAASGMGGYLAGRLRTRWINTHTDEVYFRDTVHGFLAWAIASLATAALLTSATGSIIGGGVKAGASIASTATVAATAAGASVASSSTKSDEGGGSMGYFVDSLFRSDVVGVQTVATPTGSNTTATMVTAGPVAAGTVAEVGRIFVSNFQNATLPPDDARYVGQIVAQRTGLTQQESEKRVNDTYARAQLKLRAMEAATREAADRARKASSYAALWLFISMLTGAFVASFAATYGGRRRDA
ncbi:MAG: hypothetical protein LH481_06385 [Burkholderiales bacterium]|nr:hypothetical protein [Burkholderiales bacterium]